MARVFKFCGILVLGVFLAALIALAWVYLQVTESLPVLEGEVRIQGLSEPVAVERDDLGVPTVRGENRIDVSRALGFLHGQERFFQMDLLRRQAAGELAELIGEAVVEVDRRNRIHRLRPLAERIIAQTPIRELAILNAYVEGVNEGLASLGEKPFEYLVLGLDPEPWRAEDSVLAIYAMFMVLNDERGRREAAYDLVYDLLPEELARFLCPDGTEWDAPVVGEAYGTGPVPGPEIADLRRQAALQSMAAFGKGEPAGVFYIGSNNWAVAGSRTRHGGAILANDMHLAIGVPNTWYRAALDWKDEEGSARRVVGVTLPGSPAVVVGSNTHVAWGFTNTQGDWVDLVIVEMDPNDPESYRTPEGLRKLERHTETIAVRDAESQTFEILSTIWGPIIDQDHHGRSRALRWIAHEIDGVNFGLLGLETVTTVEEAQAVANQSGIPPQNFVCVDESGSIGWTVMGRIPRRVGFDGRLSSSWADGTRAWDGWLEPEDYPRIVDPDPGVIWTANSRVTYREDQAKIGDGGMDIGARATQIRDGLLSIDQADEAAMLAVQLDDRALFLERWRSFLLEVLTEEALRNRPSRAPFRKLVEETWTGHASVNSVSYRLARGFRNYTFERVYGWLTAPCREADDQFDIYLLDQWEGPLWKLVNLQPPHLLDPRYESWNDALLAAVDDLIEYYEQERGGLSEDRTWGEMNTTSIQHPLSRAIPALSRWLDVPPRALPGDSNMPRVQGPGHGASERLAVSPGREDEGYFHMPVGQSGHPLSPYYRAGHEAWEEGRPTPFLPGPAEHVLRLSPQ